jgi:AraC family transcriptional regulator
MWFWFQRIEANYFALHRHPEPQVAIAFDARRCDFGWQDHAAGLVERQAGGDLVWFLPANTDHTVRLRHTAFWIVFYFDPAVARSGGREPQATLGPLGNYVQRDPLIGELSAALRWEHATDAINDRPHIAKIGTLLGSCLLRAHHADSARRESPLSALPGPITHQILQFVSEHLSEKLPLSRLAAEAGMDADHFSRRLRISTGLTAEQFVLHERLKRAKALLKTGGHKVEQVALLCGFSTHAAMTKPFTIRFGRPPRSYLPAYPRI